MTRLRLAAIVSCALVAMVLPRTSRACSGIPVCFDLELPKTGAVGVPLNAGIVIGHLGGRGELQLEKDGVAVWSGGTPAAFAWDPDGCLASYALPTLEPSTMYVLKSAGAELTRFTTSDKAQASAGTPPIIKSLTVKVVEYPPEEQQPSACVGCTNADIAGVTFEPAVFPDTAAASVLYTWSLYLEGSPEGPPAGPMRFSPGVTSLGCSGPYPCWLSPCANRSVGSRYCARVWAWGLPYSPDQAAVSQEVCTTVVRETRPGHAGMDAGVGRDVGPTSADASTGQPDAGAASGGAGCSSAGPGAGGSVWLLLLGCLRRRAGGRARKG